MSARPRRRSGPARLAPTLAAAFAATTLLPFAAAAAVTTPVALHPALNASGAGNSLSQTLLPSYAGMGIEPTNLPAFTGTDAVNPLTFGCLDNLRNFTGIASHLRIGGNTGDNALYDPDFMGYGYHNNNSGTNAGVTANWYYGPRMFTMLDRLPHATPITFGLNLAYNGSDSVDRIVEQAASILDGLHNVTVAGFEVGNEPDLYVKNLYRPEGYSEPQYGDEWLTHVQAIHSRVLAPRNKSSNFFEVAVTATTANQNGHPFRIQNLAQAQGGVASENGVYISGFNQHDYLYYIGVSGFPMTSDWLLNLDNTVNQFTEWASQAAQAKVTGKPYYLREMGSIGPEGIQGISDTFANTLWTFNFFLYAATVQVSSVQLHSTQTSYSAPWQPIEFLGTQPHVRSCYYAYAAIAQLIGAQCNTRVASIPMDNAPDEYAGRLAAYAIYQDNGLSGIALINTHTKNISAPTNNTVDFSFTLPGLAGQTLFLSHLTAAGTDATKNTTWNGLSFETLPNAQPEVVNRTLQTIQVDQGGTAHITVRDGSALVANLGARLGSNPVVNQTNCNALSHSGEGGDSSPNGTGSGSAPTFRSTTGFTHPHKGLSTGAIIALAVAIPCGVLFLLTVLGVTIWLLCRRRRRRNAAAASAQQRDDTMEKGTGTDPSPGPGAAAATGAGAGSQTELRPGDAAQGTSPSASAEPSTQETQETQDSAWHQQARPAP